MYFSKYMRFSKKEKLPHRFVGSFRILRRIEKVAYRLDLPPNLSNVHAVFHVSTLPGYEPNPSHIINHLNLIVEEDVAYAVKLIAIIDQHENILRVRTIPLLKVI